MSKRVLVGMSGGVDSSAAAALLQEQGYEPVGCTLRLWEEPGAEGPGPAAEDALRVCRQLGIEHHVFDARAEFRTRVVEPFAAAYERGETPNPCALCNREAKIWALLRAADDLRCPLAATGHYARGGEGGTGLRRARFREKDQSYFLCFLTPDQLARLLFPLGELSKAEVRAAAEARGLCTARKRDSQDICFVPDGDYAAFLRRFTGRDYPAGDFLGPDGAVLGRHRGLVRYTIGQRKGLGLALPEPLYVREKDPARNAVLLDRNEALYSRTLRAGELNALRPEKLLGRFRTKVQVRSRARAADAFAERLPDGTLAVEFDEPQRAICPGQAAVLYDGDEVLAGGIIRPPAQ